MLDPRIPNEPHRYLTLARFCVDPNGGDVLVLPEGAPSVSTEEDGQPHEAGNAHSDEQSTGEMECHFHAGVE